jgi:phosphatidylinositol alpha-mannosyltransferase
MRHYLNRLDARIAVSETAATSMRKHFGGEYRVLPNGVDVSGFQAGTPISRYDDEKFNLLFVGRLDPRNGLDDMIAAAALASKRIPVRLLVMGDGPLRPQYEALAREALGENAVFLGTRCASRPDWYATADALCAPIKIATFGIVLTEAMAAGLPIIANRIPGFTDVMQDGREGLFVNTEDHEAFADRIVHLAKDQILQKRLGKNGFSSVQKYDWPLVTKAVVDVYRDLLRQAPKRAA